MVPGMGHCSGGPGTTTFDMLAPLEQWVEKGVAPQSIVASRPLADDRRRTRPLCPWPQTAHWKGSGSTDDASNFVCAVPGQAPAHASPPASKGMSR